MNLAVGDAIKNRKYIKDALDVAIEASKLIKFSPKQTAKLESLRSLPLILQVFVYSAQLSGQSEWNLSSLFCATTSSYTIYKRF